MAALFFWESRNLKIETDILESMPHNDPVLADARLIIKHLPIQDKVFINLEQTSPDRDKLVSTAVITFRQTQPKRPFHQSRHRG